jgi:hypothetical protein
MSKMTVIVSGLFQDAISGRVKHQCSCLCVGIFTLPFPGRTSLPIFFWSFECTDNPIKQDTVPLSIRGIVEAPPDDCALLIAGHLEVDAVVCEAEEHDE